MTEPRTLATDPRWLPDAIDIQRRLIRFAHIDRAEIVAQPFLDQRKDAVVTGWAQASFDDIAAHAPPAPAPAFIFHSAFCGSTLLARALDTPGKSLSLKEPNILPDLVNARRMTPALQTGEAYDALAGLIIGLLARRHHDDERIVIKPTNTASPIAGFAVKRGMKTLMLYGDARSFLLSLLKKGEQGRAFMRQQYNIFALDGTALSAIEARKAMALTDLQVGALIWRHQLEEFERLLKAAPSAASLDYTTFIGDPARAIAAIANHFGSAQSTDEIRAIVDGPVFRTNSKFSGETFGAAHREADNAGIEKLYAPDLDRIIEWLKPISLGGPFAMPLSRPLISA